MRNQELLSKSKIRNYFVVGIYLLCFLALWGNELLAEIASDSEMDLVCQNWVTQMALEKGDWAGQKTALISGSFDLMAGDTLLGRIYQVSPSGFVLVSALKEMTPVKAYSDMTSLSEDDMETGMIQLYKDVLSSRMSLYAYAFGSLEASQPQDEEAIFGHGQKKLWERLTLSEDKFLETVTTKGTNISNEAGPLLSSSWGQVYPYNYQFPMGDGGQCVVGCVATAASQLMKYWEWPENGVGSHSYYWDGDNSCGGSVPGGTIVADFSDSYDWANMPDSCDLGCVTTQVNAVEELNFEVATAFEMDMGACGSGSWLCARPIAFSKFFKYNPNMVMEARLDNNLVEWFTKISDQVDKEQPIMYTIHSHEIICDGVREQTAGQYEFHMNYGWFGNSTAWYVLDSLACSWVPPNSLCPPANEFMATEIYPQTEPILEYKSHSIDDSMGDNDGLAESGETIELGITINNKGWTTANPMSIVRTTDENVAIVDSIISYQPNMTTGEDRISLSLLTIEISSCCPNPYIATIEVEIFCDEVSPAIDTLLLFIGDAPGFSDNMEEGTGFWTHKAFSDLSIDEWHLEDYRASDGNYSWKAGGAGGDNYSNFGDGALISPPILLPDSAILSFEQFVYLQMNSITANDGGIVMIDTGNGEWEQLTPIGGYPYYLWSSCNNYMHDTPCYSNMFNWRNALFDLSEYSGVVRIMFRLIAGPYNTMEGWYIDNVEITSKIACVDYDGDGYGDPSQSGNYCAIDNCPNAYNPGQEDNNCNGIGDICESMCGDVNLDTNINILDITNLINYLYKNGEEPPILDVCDVDGTGTINILDITFLISYLYKNGADPHC